MKLFTRQFFCCYIFLMALAACGPRVRVRERWRLRVRLRVDRDADTHTSASTVPRDAPVATAVRDASTFSVPRDASIATTPRVTLASTVPRGASVTTMPHDVTASSVPREASVATAVADTSGSAAVSATPAPSTVRELPSNQPKGVDEPLGGRRSIGRAQVILDERQTQTEVDDYPVGGPNQSEVLDGNEYQDNSLDEASSYHQNQGNVPEDKQSQDNVRDKNPEAKQNQGEGYEKINNKPSEALENGIYQGDAIDKVLYATLIDRRNQGDGQGKALKIALGTRGNPTEELNEAIDKALIDQVNPSEALDKALHETLGFREHQSDELNKAIDAALGDGTNIDNGFQGQGQADPRGDDYLVAGNDYRRAFDADDNDSTQLLNELSINDTTYNDDDVIRKVIAAAMDTDGTDRKGYLKFSPSMDVVNSASTVVHTNVTAALSSVTVKYRTKKESAETRVPNMQDEESNITFFKNNIDDEDRVYVDEAP